MLDPDNNPLASSLAKALGGGDSPLVVPERADPQMYQELVAIHLTDRVSDHTLNSELTHRAKKWTERKNGNS